MMDFFNKFYELEMKICAKEARRLKSKEEFRKLMEKMKRFLDFLAQYEVYGYLKELVVDLVEEFARLGKALKWEIIYFIGFLRERRLWSFSFLNSTLQAWDPPTFEKILRFNFSYEMDF